MRRLAPAVVPAALALVLGGCVGGSGGGAQAQLGVRTRSDLRAAGWQVTSLALPGTSALCSVLGHRPRVLLSAAAARDGDGSVRMEVVHLPTMVDAEHCLNARLTLASRRGYAGFAARTEGYTIVRLSDPAHPEIIGQVGPWFADVRMTDVSAGNRAWTSLETLLQRWRQRRPVVA